MIRLKTKRLIIRDPLPTDIDDWHCLLYDSKTMYYLPEIMTRTLEESRNNLEAAISETKDANRTKYFFAIEHCETGAFIGTVGYTVTKTTPLGKFVGAGYFILPEYHGQGFMTEVLGEVMRFAFEDDGVFRISTGCLIENRASERVMQKCGLIKEAEYKFFTWHDGRMKDRVEYRILKDEWRLLQKKSLLSIENVTDKTRPFIDAQIAKSWAGPYVVTKGILHDTRTHPGFVAVDNGDIVGCVLYNIANSECEITVLESLCEGRGIGGALVNAVIQVAKDTGCHHVWLVTTNDNIHAIRFYQRFGFSLKAVHINAMEVSRKLKPQIPLTGNDDIPIAHEFEFEMVL